jgi:hypothetical protein
MYNVSKSKVEKRINTHSGFDDSIVIDLIVMSQSTIKPKKKSIRKSQCVFKIVEIIIEMKLKVMMTYNPT